MRTKQRGLTFIGWLVLLVPLALVFYTGIRLTPVYLNYMKVARSLDAIQTEFKADSANASAIRNSLGKHFDIESVDYPTVKDIQINRDGGAWIVDATFDDQAPLFSNISIQVAFHKVVQIGSPGND